jgi:hypothetical protein
MLARLGGGGQQVSAASSRKAGQQLEEYPLYLSQKHFYSQNLEKESINCFHGTYIGYR